MLSASRGHVEAVSLEPHQRAAWKSAFAGVGKPFQLMLARRFCCRSKCVATGFFKHHSLALFNRFPLVVRHNKHVVQILSAAPLYHIKYLILFMRTLSTGILHKSHTIFLYSLHNVKIKAKIYLTAFAFCSIIEYRKEVITC